MKYKRLLVFGLPLLVVIILILAILGIKLSLVINPELRIQTTMESTHFQAINGDMISLIFYTNVISSRTCATTCKEYLRDVSSGDILFSKKDTVDSLISTVYDYKVKSSFSGEKQLQYVVSCQNKITSLCSTTNDSYVETTFITIDHNQSIFQKNKENKVFLLLKNISLQLAKTQSFIDESSNILSQVNISFSQKITLVDSLKYLVSQLDSNSKIFNDLLSLWDRGEYESIEFSSLSGLSEETLILENDANKTHRSFVNISNKINVFTDDLTFILDDKNKLFYLEKFYSLQENLYKEKEIHSLLSEIDAHTLAFNLGEILSFEKFFSVYNKTINEFAEYDSIISNTILHMSKLTNAFVISNNSSLLSSCININSSLDFIKLENEKRNETLHEKYSILLLNETFISLLENYSLSIYKNASFNNTDYPFSSIGVFHKNWTSDLESLYSQFCFSYKSTSMVNIFKLNISYTPVFVEPIIINSFEPDCCLFGACFSCSSQKNYPLIMIHGHAFSKATSVDASLHSFSKLQSELESSGYVNVGELSDYPFASWQNVFAPISIRATYYYTSYLDFGQIHFFSQKSSSIENYAIRLKEIIDEVRLKSASDKVIIIAHSMGGLVARDYLSLFGEDSVDTLILIATPNNGIAPSASKYCALLGAKIECEEMKQDSVFLKRLKTFVPRSTHIYTIAGDGCDTDGYAGDGVVMKESVALSYAKNNVVKGFCADALGVELHSDIINPELYPQVVDIIKKILLSSS